MLRRRASGGKRDWQRMTRSHGWLLRHEGRSVDELGEALWEAGWFGERPTVAVVLELIEQRIHSGTPMFPPGHAAPPSRLDTAGDDELDGLIAEIRDHPWAQELAGASDFEDLLVRAALLRAEHPEIDPGLAFERAVERKALEIRREVVEATDDDWYEVTDDDPFSFLDGPDDAGGAGAGGDGPAGAGGAAGAGGGQRAAAGDDPAAAGERLAELPPEDRAAFLDPDAKAAQAQADSLEHDARTLLGEAASPRPPAGVTKAKGATNPHLSDGERVRFRERVGYLGEAGDTYTVESAGRKEAFFRNDRTGASSSLPTWQIKRALDSQTLQRVAPEMNALTPDVKLDLGEGVDPAIAARQAEEARLRAEAPLRGENRTGQAQDGTMGLGLFDAADQPSFRLDVEGEERSLGDLLRDLDGEGKDLGTIRDCL